MGTYLKKILPLEGDNGQYRLHLRQFDHLPCNKFVGKFDLRIYNSYQNAFFSVKLRNKNLIMKSRKSRFYKIIQPVRIVLYIKLS